MKRHLSGYIVRADASKPITFLASSPEPARDGMSIEVDAWDTRNYMRNPVVLFGHAYDSLPIGRTVKLTKERSGLIADIEFDQGDQNAKNIEGKIRRGYLNSVSVGFNIVERTGDRVTKAELLEISVVPIPADTNAVALARSAYQRATQAPIRIPDLSTLSASERAELERFLRHLKANLDEIDLRRRVNSAVRDALTEKGLL